MHELCMNEGMFVSEREECMIRERERERERGRERTQVMLIGI